MIRSKKGLAMFLIFMWIVGVLSACNNNTNNNTSTSHPVYDEFLTVDVFSSQANYQGLQIGWFADIVKERFNMELNIIAPNVSGGGDALFQTRLAGGNLGDIIMIGAENGRLEDLVTAGLMQDMSPYAEIMTNALQYKGAIERIQSAIGISDGIYGIPSNVSSSPATEPGEATEPTYGPYLRWDLYTEVGSPEMATLEDLLPVLKSMQDLEPETETGQKTYAFSLFSDWDGNMVMMGKQPTCFYGYDEVGFLLSKADGSDYQSIIDDDSQYIRALHLFFEANQLGLLDPASRTQTWDDVWNKYLDGAVLFSFWPWLSQSAYNTTDHLDEGKGFMMAPINDLQILSHGATPTGTNYVVGIGSKAQDPERMAAFIDWLYSPEGIMYSTTMSGSNCGPEGLTWEMVDGRPELTAFGVQAMLRGGTDVPEAWGGGTWGDGISQLNFNTVLAKDINPVNGEAYDFRMWESYIEFTTTPLHESWQTQMDALSTFEYLEKNDQYIVAPGTDYISPAETSEINFLRSQCKQVILDKSWQMIYAKDENTFQMLLSEMREIVLDIGYEEVLAWDIQLADGLNAERDRVRSQEQP